jgi:hypothetical protein
MNDKATMAHAQYRVCDPACQYVRSVIPGSVRSPPAARQRSRSVEYVVVDDDGHAVLKVENRVRCYNAITIAVAEILIPGTWVLTRLHIPAHVRRYCAYAVGMDTALLDQRYAAA